MRKFPELRISLIELLVVFTIQGALIALLTPAVNQVLYDKNEPQSLPWIAPFAADNNLPNWATLAFIPFFAIGFGLLGVAPFVALKWLSSKIWGTPFRWFPSPRPSTPDAFEFEHSKEDPQTVTRHIWSLGLYSLFCSISAALLLIDIARRTRIDRRRRRPVVTWEGLTEDWVQFLSVTAWSLSIAALLFSLYAICRFKGDLPVKPKVVALVGGFLGAFNLLGSCFYSIAVYED